MAWADLTAEEKTLMRLGMTSDGFMASWLIELQLSALGCLLAHPQLIPEATAHLFDAGHRVYVEIFRAMRKGNTDFIALYEAVHAKLPHADNVASLIADLSDYPVTVVTARHKLNSLKKFVRWQYERSRKMQGRHAQ